MTIDRLARLSMALIATMLLVFPIRLSARDAMLPWPAPPSAGAARARVAAIAELGRKLFFDPALSASGRMSCATCHDPAHGFAAPDLAPVRIGGPGMNRPGMRAVPGLTYTATAPPFQLHFFDTEDETNESIDQGPTGGRTWDGRIDRLRDQARLPLLDPNEMANPDSASLVAAARTRYAAEIEALYGPDVFADVPRAMTALTEALEYFQQTSSLFSRFDSKYDAFLRGAAELSPAEARGFAVFNDPARGNCAKCHPGTVNADGKPPLFTDFGYTAAGVPRNRAIPANTDPAYYDLGLCGPLRTDLAAETRYCGMFKTPSLRNAALKQNFFHNGAVHTLRDAVAFYAERDTRPEKWYPVQPDGSVETFDDLPPRYRGNVSAEAPFGRDVHLSDDDVDTITAFLRTLTDGYQPAAGH